MNRLSMGVLLLWFVGVVTGCGSSEDQTELPPDQTGTKLVSELSQAELEAYCTRMTETVKEVVVASGECGEGTPAATVPSHDECVAAPIPCQVSVVEGCWAAIAADTCGTNKTEGPCAEMATCLQANLLEDSELDKAGNLTTFTDVGNLGLRISVNVDETSNATDGNYTVSCERNIDPGNMFSSTRTYRLETYWSEMFAGLVGSSTGQVACGYVANGLTAPAAPASINLAGQTNVRADFYQHYLWWWFGIFGYHVGTVTAPVDGLGGALTVRYDFY